MSLILETIRHPLDPLYEDVAHRKQQRAAEVPGGSPRAAWPQPVLIAVVTLVLGVLIGCAASALRAPKTVAVDGRSTLIAHIESKQSRNDTDAHTLASLRDEVGREQAGALTRAGSGDLRQELEAAETTAGLKAMSGAGLELTLDNPAAGNPGSADSDPRTGPSANALSSRDLQRVVNGLWQAGARGVGVNDQRLTSQSAIRFAGSAVLVNYRPLTTPYVITAVGPEGMDTAFTGTDGGTFLHQLQRNGFRASTQPRSSVELPAAAAVPMTYAKVDK